MSLVVCSHCQDKNTSVTTLSLSLLATQLTPPLPLSLPLQITGKVPLTFLGEFLAH